MNENNGIAPKPKIDRAVQDKIGRELRAMYEELLRQPLPENLIAPLRAMDAVGETRARLEEAAQAMRESSGAPPSSPDPLRAAKSA